METTKSLGFEIQRMVMGLLIVLVLSYSFALLYYFTAGLNIASNVGFETLLKYNQNSISKFSKNEAALAGFTIANKYDELPQHIKELFPKNEITSEVPQIKFNANSHNANTHLVFFLAEHRDGTNQRYIFKELDSNTTSAGVENVNLDLLEHAIFIGGVTILILVYVISKLTTYNIRRHISGLQEWAEGLEPSTASQEPPDFRYEELNTIADRLVKSFRRVSKFVEREQKFLQYASHELRTPIATISGNVSIMNKWQQEEAEAEVTQRIGRACKTMGLIVSTLLWLAREKKEELEQQTINLKEFVDTAIREHEYLIENKKINIAYSSSTTEIKVPMVPLQIVLANLIRNAFQHTQTGKVDFRITGNKLYITNTVSKSNIKFEKSEIGIGLSIVERIISRLDWKLSMEVKDGLMIVILEL